MGRKGRWGNLLLNQEFVFARPSILVCWLPVDGCCKGFINPSAMSEFPLRSERRQTSACSIRCVKWVREKGLGYDCNSGCNFRKLKGGNLLHANAEVEEDSRGANVPLHF
jgi:hypothetical protein